MTIELSHDPRTGAAVDGPPYTSPDGVDVHVKAADAAFPAVSTAHPAERRRWLDTVADALDDAVDELVALADSETALGEVRLRGELTRAAVNMRYYAAAGEAGDWLRPIVQTLPGVNLSRANLPLGPVAVFGASNFPFQFGVLGHDTCSALAAGCPVVAKAHPAHPRLSVRLTEIAVDALTRAGAPSGTLGLVVGFDAGTALVDHPAITAVAFTGSLRGGQAIVEQARRRSRPIPVYAEMGTVNPVVVTPAGVARMAAIAEEFAASFTLGVGQYCTKPGLLLAPRGSGVTEAVAASVRDRQGAWLLTDGIATAYRSGTAAMADGAELLAEGPSAVGGYGVGPVALRVDPDRLQPGSSWLEECFGPVALVAECDDLDEVLDVVRRMQPSLTGAVYGGGADDPDVARVVAVLAGQVGRVVVDGAPTGVACVDAMHHGGPWPSTSEPGTTSVGARALERFTRPVAFQNVPDAALPPALQQANPWNLRRDG
ncbi:NADP-dependent aldehyde dehydrogenase [Kribbella aluminosa]|uniref:NADP-dependent aldehyde dehydrogenase n=1 Tax=Kribbella aluminosa TaxID=416017 RepID=A0ABS4UK22_9ACTN|nr:aldehyde dehydrogenase family protein [Kribbella aluminosa]MBP2351997.1 NADP-dependent aldehyde dehydrogenase [Kribbella aluminosa]